MKKLSEYDNTVVRIQTDFGECLSGPCEWIPAGYFRAPFCREEEGLKLGDAVIFAGQIQEIEVLRSEVCIPVRDWPEAQDEITAWFHEKAGVPPEVCRQSIRDCLGNETGLPQWYVVARGNRIVAGCGVIANASPAREELTPELCAVYVEEEFRNRGIAGFLLQYVCKDMAGLGFETLYLLSDIIGFFERYGWEYVCTVRGDDGEASRVYVRRAREM